MGGMKHQARKVLTKVDKWVCDTSIRLGWESNRIIFFLFHNILQDNEIRSGIADPQGGVTLKHYELLFLHFQRAGYRFVSANNILCGLPDGKYVHMTFDDGYYNNFRILPLLEKYNIPISLFISSNHIKMQKCFWWDALYRAVFAKDHGLSHYHYNERAAQFKVMKNDEIEAALIQEFGKDILTPKGDVDRPMTVEELQKFAAHPLVEIGNHTANHAVLTNYSSSEAQEEISSCERDLTQWLGKSTRLFAFPNGNYDDAMICLVDKLGYKMGFSCDFVKVPVQGWQHKDLRFKMGRFSFYDTKKIESEILRYRADVSPFVFIKNKLDCLKHLKTRNTKLEKSMDLR